MLGLKIKDGVLVGAFNGAPVVGVEVGAKIFWDRWYWLPRRPFMGGSILWLCFRLSWGWEYSFRRKS